MHQKTNWQAIGGANFKKVTIDAGNAALEVASTDDIAVIGKDPHAANVDLSNVNKLASDNFGQ